MLTEADWQIEIQSVIATVLPVTRAGISNTSGQLGIWVEIHISEKAAVLYIVSGTPESNGCDIHFMMVGASSVNYQSNLTYTQLGPMNKPNWQRLDLIFDIYDSTCQELPIQ